MNFSAKRDDLSKVLGHVQSIVERRGTIPVLANVKITANEDNTLELLATDMDLCIEAKISAEVKTPFCTTIPALTLYEIVRKVPNNADISFIKNPANDDLIELRAGSSDFSLPTISADQYPSFEQAVGTTNFKMSSEILRALLSKTRHAISNEETRYYLNGVYMHAMVSEDGAQVLRVVATDGHRLSRAQTLMPDGCEDMPGIIIPKKAVAEVVKLLDGFVGEVDIALSDKKIIFYIGNSIITSKLIDGKFPDYERVIPKNTDKNLQCSKKDLVNAVDLVVSVSNDKTKTVRFDVAKDKLTITATSELNGNAKGLEELPITFDSSEKLSISFNARYVLDALTSIDGDTVAMQMSNNLGAVIVSDLADSNFIYILMPMQL